MRTYGRELRVADYLREELSLIIRSEMRDPRVGMLAINDVKVSRDLSYADVYVASVEAPDDASRRALLEALNGAGGFLRSAVAKHASMRTTPKLRFHYDEVTQRAARLESLIDEAVEQDASNKARRGDD